MYTTHAAPSFAPEHGIHWPRPFEPNDAMRSDGWADGRLPECLWIPMDLIGAFYQSLADSDTLWWTNIAMEPNKSYGTTSQNHHWSLVPECSRYPSTKSPFLRVKSLLFLGKCVNWSSKPPMNVDLDHVSSISPVSFSTSHATQRMRWAASWSTRRSSNMSERSIESISNTSIHAEPPGAIAIAAIVFQCYWTNELYRSFRSMLKYHIYVVAIHPLVN